MKKGRILNSMLNEAIARMGHGDTIVICDAGFPIPQEKRIDLAIERDKPSIPEIFELLVTDLIYERVITAAEQQRYNPLLFKRLSGIADRCSIETVAHAEFIAKMPATAKFIVRTGSFEPWGNVALVSGVDAPVWFQKAGTIIPDYYADRAKYTER